MDYIERALKKAAERGAVVRGIDGTFRGGPLDDRYADAAPIEHRETRVIKVMEEVYHNNRVIAGMADHKLADAFRILRARVMQRLNENGHKTLAITSPNRGEGKTLIATNLAISLAMRLSTTVLLVDLDLRRPGIDKIFKFGSTVGLSDYLLEDLPLSQCLINPGVDRLVVLPAGRPRLTSSELICSPKMIHLAEELKNRYRDRLVIYDLPPLLATDDALAFLDYADACLLVFEEGSTRKADVKRAMELLHGRNVIGSVFNKSSEGKKMAYSHQ